MTAAAVIRSGGVGRAERSRGRASWALAARLARREVRRRKGRTALVVALVAIPVIAMTIASVVYRTTRDTTAEQYARQYGASDMVLSTNGGFGGAAIHDVRALPEGTREVVVNEIFDEVTPAEGGRPTFVRFSTMPLDDPITAGIVRLTAGRAPTSGTSEVLLSPEVADDLRVGVGDTLRLNVPSVTFDVVGLGRRSESLDEPLMVAGRFDFGAVRSMSSYSLIDLPPGANAESLRLGPVMTGDLVTPETYWTALESSRSDVVWGWVGGALALTVLGIIISAAFATSARRQLVTLGQLASNGADRKLLRRTLALQGAWSGAIGAAVGIGLGLVIVLPQHGLLERIAGRSLGPITVTPIHLLVIALTGVGAATVAAFVPSRTITKVPVLSALGGRRPLGAVPRWLVPLGVALFVGGLGLVTLAAASDSVDNTDDRNLTAGVSVLGGLGLLFGMCCATPVIIGVLGPVGERLTGTARLAARSVARARTRSAAIVTAIAAAGALSIGGGTAVATTWDRDESIYSTVPYLQDNMVTVQAYDIDNGGVAISQGDGVTIVQTVPATVPVASSTPGAATPTQEPVYDAPPPVFTAVPADVVEELAAVLPGASVVPIRLAAFDPAPETIDSSPLADGDRWYSSQFVADEGLLDAMGMSARDRRTLDRVGVLAGWSDVLDGRERTVTAETQSGPLTFDVAPMRDAPDMWAFAEMPMITPAKAAALGLPVGSSETLLIAPHSLTEQQRHDVQLIGGDATGTGPGSSFLPAGDLPTSGHAVNTGSPPPSEVSRTLIDGLIVAGALLFILAVVAVGLSLAAAESREERDVLLAVGAPPRAMRRVSAQKAVLLTALGGVLAIPTGFLPVVVVLAQVYDDPIRFPWLVALGCVVVVPLIVGAAALAGSAVAQRVRPIHMSTLATD